MAKKRSSKPALGQNKKVVVSVPKEDVEKMEELHDINMIDEAKEMASEKFDVKKEDVKVEVVPEVEEKPEQPIEPEVEEVKEEEVKPRKKVSELTAAEYRYYMNTGKIL